MADNNALRKGLMKEGTNLHFTRSFSESKIVGPLCYWHLALIRRSNAVIMTEYEKFYDKMPVIPRLVLFSQLSAVQTELLSSRRRHQ